jgi:hypothetical protein
MAGSRAGIPNKNKGALKRKLIDRFGAEFDVVVKMAINADKLEQIADAEPDDTTARKNALDGWDKVASYIEPKLKATEHSGGIDMKTVVKRIDLSGSADADS